MHTNETLLTNLFSDVNIFIHIITNMNISILKTLPVNLITVQICIGILRNRNHLFKVNLMMFKTIPPNPIE